MIQSYEIYDICANKIYNNCLGVPKTIHMHSNELERLTDSAHRWPDGSGLLQKHSNAVTQSSLDTQLGQQGKETQAESAQCRRRLPSSALPAMRAHAECTIPTSEKIRSHGAVFLPWETHLRRRV